MEDAHRRLDELHPVDVRGEHEFRGPLGHVRGARLIPLPELEGRVSELPSARPLLMICRSGGRSGMACERLEALGLGPVLNLAGGMIAWNRAGLPTEWVAPASFDELIDSIVAWMAMVSPHTRETARQVIAEALEQCGASIERPSAAALGEALARVEQAVCTESTPPDLDLTLASFRRSLENL